MNRILFVGAHHDDLELALGGSVRRWVKEGRRVCAAILTDSQWSEPDGATVRRDPGRAIADCARAAEVLGYQPYHLAASKALELTASDAIRVELIRIMEAERIDAVIAPWPHDAHPDHRVASELALDASHKIGTVLTVRISWHPVPHPYRPSYLVDVSETLEDKLRALRCYTDEWRRAGALWERYVRSSAALHGLERGTEAAEAFEVVKLSR